MSTKQDGSTFTARDFELLAGAFNCTKDPVQVRLLHYHRPHRNPADHAILTGRIKGRLRQVRRAFRLQELRFGQGDMEWTEEEAEQVGQWRHRR